MTKTHAAAATKLPASPAGSLRFLTRPEFERLANVPPELEWFANFDNPRTRRAYKIDLQEFMGFTGIKTPDEMRAVRRAHVLAWRKDLELRNLTARRCGGSSPPCRLCSNISASEMPSRLIQ
jgi:hypothetical protein